MKGPKTMPMHLKLLRGRPGHEKLRGEEIQPAIPPDIPEPPSHLCRYACAEWRRIATECYRLRLLTVLDVQTLAAYCQAYAIWRDATELLAEAAKADPESRGMTVERRDREGREYYVKNPLLTAVHAAASEMVRYAGEFGLTPSARARIAAGIFVEKAPGKFDGLLAG